MTLAVWKPKNELIPLRHTWIDGEKQKPAFDTHYSISDYRTHDKIDRDWITFQFTKIRSGNTGEGFGQAIPELSKKKHFERQNKELKEELLSTIILDFDKNYSEISANMGNRERVKVLEAKHPFLENLEMVAWCSSSAFVKGDSNRANMHIIVFLDKGYTREEIKLFLKQEEGVDNALGTKSQPLFVTPPKLINTEANNANIGGFYQRGGMRLNLRAYVPEVSAGSPIPREIIKLPNDYKKLQEELIKKIGNQQEGAGRYELFSELVKREAFKKDNRDFDALYTIFSHPQIRGNRDDFWIKDRINFGQNIVVDSEIDFKIWQSNWKKHGDNQEDLYEIAEEYGLTIENIQTRDIRKKIEIKDRMMGNKAVGHFDVRPIQTKDLQVDLDVSKINNKGIILLKSGCGTGKTRSLHNYIKEHKFKRVLYITQLKATIGGVRTHMSAHGLDFANYEDIASKDAKDYFDNDLLAITDQSLPKLFQSGAHCRSYELIVIDECETFYKGEGKERPDIFRALSSLAKNANAVLMMDADITEEVSGRAALDLAQDSKVMLIKNESDYLEGMRIRRILGDKMSAYQQIWDLLEEGLDVYCHVSFNDNKKKLSSMKRVFEECFPNLIVDVFHSDRKDADMHHIKTDSRGYIESRKKDGKQYLLIVSPWAIVGWDYWSDKHQFDATVGIYDGKHKTAPHIHQGLRRPRKTELHYVWITPEYHHQPVKAHKELQEKAIEGYSKMEKDHSQLMSDVGRNRITVEQSHISYHFKMIVEERDADYQEIECKPNPGCLEVFKSFEEDEIDKEIRLIKTIPDRYTWFVKKFAVEPDCDCFDLIHGHCEFHPVDWDEEKLRKLWDRDVSIKEGEIRNILEIWRMDEKQRSSVKDRLGAWVGCVKGALLDHIDSLINLYDLNDYESFADFTDAGSKEELVIMVDEEQGKRLRELLKDVTYQLSEDDYFFKKKDGIHHWNWLKKFFKKLDFDVCIANGRGRQQVKTDILNKYSDLGITRGIKLVKDKIPVIDAHIKNKIENNERLLSIEWEWLNVEKKRISIKRKEHPRIDVSEILGGSYRNIRGARKKEGIL